MKKINSFQLSEHQWSQDIIKYSPDGRYLLSYNDKWHKDKIYIWDAFSGRGVFKLDSDKGSILFASFLSTADEVIFINKEGVISIWDILENKINTTNEMHVDLDPYAEFCNISLSANGHYLYNFFEHSKNNGSFQVINLHERKNYGKYNIIPDGVVYHASFLPDESLFLCLDGKRTKVTIKRTDNGSFDYRLKTTIIWKDEPLQRYNNIICINSTDHILLFDNLNGKGSEFESPYFGKSQNEDFAIAENGRYITFANYDLDYDGNPSHEMYTIWDLDQKSKIQTLNHSANNTWGLLFSKYGRYFTDGKAIWNVTTGDLLVEFEGNGNICTEFSPDERYAIARPMFVPETTILIDLENKSKVIKAIGGYGCPGGTAHATFSVDNNCVITTNGGHGPNFSEGYTIVWDLGTYMSRTILNPSPEYFTEVKGISQNGKCAVTRSYKKSHEDNVWEAILHIWDVDTGEMISECQGLREPIVFIPDKKHMLTASSIWDMETFSRVMEYTNHEDYTGSICVSNDGFTALSGCKDGSMALWNILSGIEVYRFRNDLINSSNPILFSPDDTLALAYGDYDSKKCFVIWNLETKELFRIIVPDQNNYSCGIFLSDNRLLISGGYEEPKISLWDYLSRKLVFILDVPEKITSLALSHDGNLLYAATSKEISTWNLNEWENVTNPIVSQAKNPIIISTETKEDIEKEKAFDINLKVKLRTGGFASFYDLKGKTVQMWLGKGFLITGITTISRDNWVDFVKYCNERDEINVEVISQSNCG